MSVTAEWDAGWTAVLRRLRSRGWNGAAAQYPLYLFFKTLFHVSAVPRMPAAAVRWLDKRIDELVTSGDGALLKRLDNRLRATTQIAALAKRSASVAALLARLTSNAQARTQATFVFKRERRYSLAQLERLPAVSQRQLLAAAARYRRGTYRSPRAFFETLAAESGEPIGKLTVERWRIAAAPKPLVPVYELWIFLSDNGTVFEAGTATPCPVHLVQGGFESTNAKPASRALADALAKTAPF